MININTVNRRNSYGSYRFVCLFLLCLASGCGSGLTDVTGTVTLDGKPVEGAALYFSMESTPSIYAIGTTDADGTYSLSTFRGGDQAICGAVPGDYSVTVVKKTSSGGASDEDVSQMTIEEQTNYRMSKAASGGKMRDKKFVYHIPKKYELAETSGLKVSIPKSGSIVQDFPLTSEK